MAKPTVQIQGNINLAGIHNKIHQSAAMEKLQQFIEKAIKDAGLRGFGWKIDVEIIEPEIEKPFPKMVIEDDEPINPGPKPLQAGPKPLSKINGDKQ